MRYKAIGFDYGGVISLYGGTKPLETVSLLFDLPREHVQEVYFRYNALANVAGGRWEDVWKSVAKELGKEDIIPEMMQALSELQGDSVLNENLLERIIRLRQSGLKIGILSNYSQGFQERVAQNGVANYADVILSSFEIGVMKPDPQAFHILCDRLGVKPTELIFVDDTPRSLESAAEVGYTPILFRDNQQLHSELSSLGVDDHNT